MVAQTLEKTKADARAQQARRGLGYAGLIFGAWAVLMAIGLFGFDLRSTTILPAIAIAALICWLFVGLFIVAHDAMHGSLAPGHPRLNSAIGAGLLMLYAGFSWKKLRAAHFDHHKHAGTEGDPDFAADHPDNPVMWYLTFLQRYFGLMSLVYVTGAVWALHLLAGVPIANLILFYALPSIASSIQLFYFGTYRPHCHSERTFADDHNARSEEWGELASLASCYHFGYHLEHHRRPDVPWWALPKARAEGADQ